jgi:hypothetical protein
MHILMVKAWGDFDCPYTVPVCCSSEFNTLKSVRNSLNDYCANHPKVDMDVKLIEDFKNPHSNLYETLCEVVNEDVASKVYAELENICVDDDVLIYRDVFTIQSVAEI